jgi:hypothetical protein
MSDLLVNLLIIVVTGGSCAVVGFLEGCKYGYLQALKERLKK